MPPFLLPHHVHACVTSGQLVLLDLRADRYFALEASAAATLAPLVRGWPVIPPAGATGCTADDGLARELLAKSLLTRSEAAGKPATPVQIERAAVELGTDPAPRPATRRLLAVATAVFRAAFLLRCASLARIVRRVQLRKAHADTRPSTPGCMAELAGAFDYLRPFLYAPRDACLFDCLAQLEFLAVHGLHPSWVFGVQARPFAAHCWIQHDGVLLNDSVVRTSRFTPILSV
jgi:hypothetical protein